MEVNDETQLTLDVYDKIIGRTGLVAQVSWGYFGKVTKDWDGDRDTGKLHYCPTGSLVLL